jgi:hypothetical protein
MRLQVVIRYVQKPRDAGAYPAMPPTIVPASLMNVA